QAAAALVVVDHVEERTVAAFRLQLSRPDAQRAGALDAHAEIDADLADRVAQVVVVAVRIARRIDHDDVATAAAYRFVQAEILEVAAVRYEQPGVLLVGASEQLAHQGIHGEAGAAAAHA